MSVAENELESLVEQRPTGEDASARPALETSTAKPGVWRAFKHRRVQRVVVGLLALLAVGVGVWWFRYRPYVSTDDARVAAPIVAVSANGAGGRVARVLVREGDRVSAGQALIELDAETERAQLDRANALLRLAEASVAEANASLALERHLALASVSKAKAGVHSAKAALSRTVHGARDQELARAQARVTAARSNLADVTRNAERAQRLVAQGASTQQSLDTVRNQEQAAAANLKAEQATLALLEEGARPEDVSISRGQVALAEAGLEEADAGTDRVSLRKRQLEKAKAQASSARAELDLAKIALDRATLRSPFGGVVVRVQADPGDHLAPGQGAVTVVDIDHAYVSANVEETSSSALVPGQVVQLSVDEGGELMGHVDVVAQSAASVFALIPAENAAGNFTKVVQRIPVRIALDPNPRLSSLRVGQSVVARIRVR